MSMSQRRRRAAEIAAARDAAPTPERSAYLESYIPRVIGAAEWHAIRPAAVQIGARIHTTGQHFEHGYRAVVRLLAWAWRKDLPLDPPTSVLNFKLIADHIAEDYEPESAAAASAQSQLRGIAKKLVGGEHAPVGATIRHKAIKPPYDEATLAAFERVIAAQRSASLRRQAALGYAAGVGAGLDSQDFRGMLGRHLKRQGADRDLEVTGRRARISPVRRRFIPLLDLGFDGLRPDELAIGNVADRRNLIAAVYSRLGGMEGLPRLEQARLRSTWLVWALTTGAPIKAITTAAGLAGVRSLSDANQYLPPDLNWKALR